MRNRRERRLIVAIDDEPRHLVGLIGDHVLQQESTQRQVGECELRGHALLAGLGRNAGQQVAAAQRRGLGQQRRQIGKRVALSADRRGVHLEGPRSLAIPDAV